MPETAPVERKVATPKRTKASSRKKIARTSNNNSNNDNSNGNNDDEAMGELEQNEDDVVQEETQDDVEEGREEEEANEVEPEVHTVFTRRTKTQSHNAYIDVMLEEEGEGDDYSDLADWIVPKQNRNYEIFF